MDEAEIVAKLGASVDEPNPSTAPELPSDPKPEPKVDDAFHDNLPLETVLEKMKLQDYFELPQAVRRSPEVDTQINRIMEWAKDETGSSEYTDLLRVINDQERIMGNKFKDNRLMRLYQFVTINAQRKRLMEQERALYG